MQLKKLLPKIAAYDQSWAFQLYLITFESLPLLPTTLLWIFPGAFSSEQTIIWKKCVVFCLAIQNGGTNWVCFVWNKAQKRIIYVVRSEYGSHTKRAGQYWLDLITCELTLFFNVRVWSQMSYSCMKSKIVDLWSHRVRTISCQSINKNNQQEETGFCTPSKADRSRQFVVKVCLMTGKLQWVSCQLTGQDGYCYYVISWLTLDVVTRYGQSMFGLLKLHYVRPWRTMSWWGGQISFATNKCETLQTVIQNFCATNPLQSLTLEPCRFWTLFIWQETGQRTRCSFQVVSIFSFLAGYFAYGWLNKFSLGAHYRFCGKCFSSSMADW